MELDGLWKHVEDGSCETPVIEELNVPKAASPKRQPSTVRVSSPPAERQRDVDVCVVVHDVQDSGLGRELETTPDLAGVVVDT